ncbi:hypothetical protein D3C84_628420 [compost metagenome]
MDQQHVAGQTGRACHALDEVEQDVVGLALVQVRQFSRVGDFVFQFNHAEGAVSLRLHPGCPAFEVAAAIAGQVIPQHFDTALGHRERVVTAIGKTGQAIAAINTFGFQGTGLDHRVDVCRHRRGAVSRVDRHFVGVGIAREHGQLACRQLVLVLIDVGGGDGE